MGLLAVELIPDYSDALAPRGHIRVGGQGTAHSALPAGRVSPQATVKNPALTLPHIEPHTVERAIVGDGQTWTVEIGRASCRERVEVAGVDGALSKKQNDD